MPNPRCARAACSSSRAWAKRADHLPDMDLDGAADADPEHPRGNRRRRTAGGDLRARSQRRRRGTGRARVSSRTSAASGRAVLWRADRRRPIAVGRAPRLTARGEVRRGARDSSSRSRAACVPVAVARAGSACRRAGRRRRPCRPRRCARRLGQRRGLELGRCV